MSSDSEDTFNEQFVWRYGEEMVEKPENGQDGDCIVHYAGDCNNYMMKVKLVNGKREGKATIWKGENPLIYLEYKNGSGE